MVRGGPITLAKLEQAAARQARAYSLHGAPMVSVSVFGAVSGRSLETTLSGPLLTYQTYAAPSVGALLRAGFDVVPTFRAPHFDIVLPDASGPAFERLLAILGPALANPYKGRR